MNAEIKTRCLTAWRYPKKVVREERLELSHLAAPEPKSGASTNSATPALLFILHLNEMVAMAGLEPATPAL